MTKYYAINKIEGSIEESSDIYANALSELVKDMNMINELYILIFSNEEKDLIKYISSEILRKLHFKKRISDENYVKLSDIILNFDKDFKGDKIAKDDYNSSILIPMQNTIFKLFIQETFYFFSVFKIELDDEIFDYKSWSSWNSKTMTFNF